MHPAAFGELSDIGSQLTAGRQRVEIAATVDADKVGAARQPYCGSARFGLRKLGQFQQGIGSGMARSCHQYRAACIGMTIPPEDIRYAVGNPACELRFAFGRYAARAEGVRCLPGA